MEPRPHFTAALFSVLALVVTVRAEPRILYEKPSAFGTVIVTEEAGLRTLLFERGGAKQSVVKIGDPRHLELAYAPVAFTGLALCAAEPRRALVVGLGGGTLPMFFRAYYPDATIDAVDIDPAVVQVARTYFGFREDDRMRAVVGDGREFIEKTRQPYDIIFLDAFGSDSVPAHLTTEEFLRAVRRALRPDGVVVGNIWGRGANPLYDPMVRTYQEVFDELYIINVQDAANEILLALPQPLNFSREALAGMARQVSNFRRFRYDLGDRVMYGFQPGITKRSDHRVLRDADLKKPPNPDSP
ncbi:MAG: fused MFS/spermidine synthase [Opitutaceae bacterium]|nr:fused MFS/spermidine synthase [Opitutaceae bacterium]